jgi:hypothetical protein
VNTIDDVSLLVSKIEADGKGIPVLLRQYPALSLDLPRSPEDPEFSDVVAV